MARHVKRSFAAFLGIWFLLVMIEPEAIHSCPVHSAGVSPGHASHPAHNTSAKGHHGSGEKSHAICSCPGDCTAGAPNALPSRAASLVDSPTLFGSVQLPLFQVAARSAPDFLLPFAIGPPAAIAA